MVELKGETRSVSLTSSSGNTFTPSTGKNGITSITVTPTNQARTVTPSTSQQTLTVNSGYSGNGTITVNAVTSSIDNNIRPEYIKKDVTILSVTGTLEGSGDIITNINDNYLVKTNGDMELLKTDSYTLGSKDTTISQTNALQIAYEHDSNIKNIQLDRITTISGNRALYYAFYSCTNLTNVDLSSLTTLSGEYALNSAFENCTSLTNVDLSSLTTVSGDYALAGVFYGCTNLTSVNFSKLAMISGSSGFTGQYALQSAFSSCTLLTTLSFPMLKSTSFGYYTNQFNNMLNGVTGCTVHFPSNLQSVIGSWRDLLTGFSGTNTTVLFDLPTTT